MSGAGLPSSTWPDSIALMRSRMAITITATMAFAGTAVVVTSPSPMAKTPLSNTARYIAPDTCIARIDAETLR